MFWVPNSSRAAFVVYYGNAQYDSLIDALNAKDTEPFSETAYTAADAIFLGWIAIAGGASSLTNPSDATIAPAGIFRSIGGIGSTGTTPVSTTLAGLSDVSVGSRTAGDLLYYNGSQWENTKSLIGNYSISGSLSVGTTTITNGSITGSLQGSSSYSTNSLSASFASTASYVLNSVSSSFATNATTASYVLNAVSSSFASTASYVLNSVSSSFATTASYVLNAVSSSFATNATTSSYVLNAVSSSFATTASYVLNAVSSSFATTSNTASYVLNAVSSSFSTNASTASYVLNAVSSSFATNSNTASYVLNAVSSSFATTASYVLGGGGGASVTNPGNNYLITSDGTAGGLVGETNLNFDGTIFNVTGSAFISATTRLTDVEERELTVIIGGTPSSLSLDLSQANVFEVTYNNNVNSFSIVNAPPTDYAGSFTLITTGTGVPYPWNWGSAVTWSGGSAPSVTSTNGKRDIYGFISTNQGTNWYGFIGAQNL